MLAKGTLLVFITFAVTSVINQIFAMQRDDSVLEPVEMCKLMLGEEFNTNLGPGAAVYNFKKAFQSLSSSQIEIKYGGPGRISEWYGVRRKRQLQKELIESYFLDLINDHRLPVQNMKDPYEWCQIMEPNIPGIQRNYGIYQMPVGRRGHSCTDYIVERLFSNDSASTSSNNDVIIKKRVLEKFYKNWSDIEMTKFRAQNIDMPLRYTPTDRQKYYIYYNFFYLYFEEYKSMVQNLMPGAGNFRSIPEYCQEDGLAIVLKSNLC